MLTASIESSGPAQGAFIPEEKAESIVHSAVVSGPRKRKKRVRYGDEDWDTENQPLSSVPKIEKEAIYEKAEAKLNDSGPLVLGRQPLGLSNEAEPALSLSPTNEIGPPIAGAKVL